MKRYNYAQPRNETFTHFEIYFCAFNVYQLKIGKVSNGTKNNIKLKILVIPSMFIYKYLR